MTGLGERDLLSGSSRVTRATNDMFVVSSYPQLERAPHPQSVKNSYPQPETSLRHPSRQRTGAAADLAWSDPWRCPCTVAQHPQRLNHRSPPLRVGVVLACWFARCEALFWC